MIIVSVRYGNWGMVEVGCVHCGSSLLNGGKDKGGGEYGERCLWHGGHDE